MKNIIDKANQEGYHRIDSAQVSLVDIKYARDVLPGFSDYVIGHAGPPVAWSDMCGPMRGAVVGAIKYEGWAENDQEAEALVEAGRIKFVSNHSVGAVGPMTGIITQSMPLFEVLNETYGNYAYCTFNEGLGKVMRFGANSQEVIDRLKWIETSLAPALKEALQLSGPINLKVIIAQALAMGDEMHQRNIAASLLFARAIMKYLAQVSLRDVERARIVDFIISNEQFFLNLAMAAAKATMDPVHGIPNCTLVTAMSRNGTSFGIRVSGLGDTWFEAPPELPQGLYFPGFSAADANLDMGDSAIVECMGIGGFAMGSAPAVVRFLGVSSAHDAVKYTRDMGEITVGRSSYYVMPTLDFQGVPMGIDIRKVVETGIQPVINTGIAHKEAGVGQVGAGIVKAPMDCFVKALLAMDKVLE
ncbi:MAG: DUF1116 domain-containing protein [bacterium]|jgi:hypothetical protein|nr:DUF1116 domain-containing protein [Bacillota bacterium]